MAFLRHSKNLVLKHPHSAEWFEWFKHFVDSFNVLSGLNPPQVREIGEELKNDLDLATPSSLWACAAASHSTFGQMVMKTDAFAVSHDVTQPICREHLEEAAKKANVANDQIDANVKSLSEYLGWDITEGLNRTN